MRVVCLPVFVLLVVGQPLRVRAADPGGGEGVAVVGSAATVSPDGEAGLALPTTLLGGTWLGKYDDLVRWKDERWPLRLGGWHWFHARQSGPLATDYGIPGLRGTYYYYLVASPSLETSDSRFGSVGAHVDFRWRDDQDRFRSFFESNYWLWEAYGWVETPAGRLKGGKVAKRFGLDWDGSWWGNVPYFDGQKLDPDYGLSLESEVALGDNLGLRTFVQYFFRDDRVNGSLVGADPESLRRADERDTVVLRAVPRLQLSHDTALEVGLSATLGRVVRRRPSGAVTAAEDELPGAVAFDVTLTWGPLRMFFEWTQGWGVLHPTHYVSGGPSNVRGTLLAGAELNVGPITARATYSAGWYDNPAAWQSLVVTGFTVRLLENVSVILEHVYWEAHGGTGDDYSLLENGYQVVLNWNF